MKFSDPLANATSIQPVIAVGIAVLAGSRAGRFAIRFGAGQSARTKLREFLMLDVLKDGHLAICAGRSEKDSPCLQAFWRQWGFRYEDLSADLIEDVFTKHALQCGTCHRETQDGLKFANVATPRIYAVPRYTTTSDLDSVRRAIGLQDQFGKLAL